MLNGLYGSATALEALSKLQESTAANLAHLNTPGHRRLVAGFSEMMAVDGIKPLPGTQADRQTADFTPGRIERTQRPLDLALSGDGFFVYQGANGEVYSRNGVLHRDTDSNELMNSDGLRILNEDRQPMVFAGELSALTVGADGSLHDGAQRVGQLAIASFEDNALLESENQTYFRQGGAVAQDADNVKVEQGARELSNTNAVTEMINLIVSTRHFEATQRAMRAISDSIQENTRN